MQAPAQSALPYQNSFYDEQIPSLCTKLVQLWLSRIEVGLLQTTYFLLKMAGSRTL